jgi:putative heme utilization carrier protein HutX
MNQIAPERMTSELRSRLQDAVEQNPSKMTLQLARELGVPEVEIIRALPADRVIELDAARSEELLRAFEALGNMHVIVSNNSTTVEVVGQFGNFSTWGEFFNVQTKSLDMHIRWRQLRSVFAVTKPSHMNGGVRTLSFQFYDQSGAAALKVFLNFGTDLPPDRLALFDQLCQRFRLTEQQPVERHPPT